MTKLYLIKQLFYIIIKIYIKEKHLAKRLAVAFTGPSNSGKTTLILKVARKLINEHQKKVAIIKHDPADKARFDVEGKDSFKFSSTGAEVVVTSPTRTTYFSNKSEDIDEIIRLFDTFDFMLVEGLKNLPLPRIGIFREKIELDYIEYVDALAVDDTIEMQNYPTAKDLPNLDLNDIDTVISWIYNNAKEV